MFAAVDVLALPTWALLALVLPQFPLLLPLGLGTAASRGQRYNDVVEMELRWDTSDGRPRWDVSDGRPRWDASSVKTPATLPPVMLPPLASRFIAGETAPVALNHVSRANEDGVGVILNLLGEHYQQRGPADADAAAYRQLVADIAESDLRARVSVKPTQLGLDVGEDVFRENYRSVVAAGADHGVFVWCDMEDATTTDATLDAFVDLAREFDGGVGLCLQANLRRTAADLQRLADVPGRIRLVKGAYDEPPAIAYQDRARVDAAYRERLDQLFRTRDRGVAVATHDPAMIEHAERLHAKHGTDFEFQLLMGVREDAQRDLAASGYDVWQYAPYGKRWLSYTYRRVRERRENLLFALRALLGS